MTFTVIEEFLNRLNNYIRPIDNSINYKFRDLKVYSSREWFANNSKKYRQVYQQYQTDYIYAEFSIYNKHFDIKDWDVEIELKCFSLRKGVMEICSLPVQRRVSMDDNIIYFREGWGNKHHGAFWEKGIYYWEAHINGEKVATKYFYVEDYIKNKEGVDDSLIKIKTVKLFEGPIEEPKIEDRIYLQNFDVKETRYVNVELTMENLNLESDWLCEFIFKFHNSARELKGQVVKLQNVRKNDKVIIVTAGQGSNIKGSWEKKSYSIDVVFMEKVIATIPLNFK